MSDYIIENARIVTPEEILEDGALQIQNNAIADIRNGAAIRGNEKRIDAEGCWLMPGFFDLHDDCIEKEIEPRPNAVFPLEVAVLSIEDRLVGHGITSIFHSFSFVHDRNTTSRVDRIDDSIRRLRAMQECCLINHFVHARYEIIEPDYRESIQQLIRDGMVHLVSIMNHTPGQGQYREVEHLKNYIRKELHMNDEDIEKLIADRIEMSNSTEIQSHIDALIQTAHEYNLAVASHDDDSVEKVQNMIDIGISISEFPVELEVAVAAAKIGLDVVVGAPNILFGKSNTGNMSALHALGAGAATIICADYYPPAMLHAVFKLYREGFATLPEAVCMVSLNPAKAVGMADESGSIELGKNADLILVDSDKDLPRVRDAFVSGRRIFSKKIMKESSVCSMR